MKKVMVLLALVVAFAFFCINNNTKMIVLAANSANDINVSSKSCLLYDVNSGTEIFSKNCDERLPIASMTKVASLMVVINEIEKGNLSLEQEVCVSEYAASVGGSSAFLDAGSSYKLSDLIMTVIVCSANDSTVALAEAVAGSEDNFVKVLNREVKEMGLKNTNFINSTGLPALDHYSTARDIAKIYLRICDNSIYKKYSKIWLTELCHPSGRKTEIVNTNRLIRSYDGCDSGKTGFTNDAGFCLVSSATRGNMRLVGVVIGARESKVRFNDMASLFDYGFFNYENRQVISSGNPIYEIEIDNSKVKTINIYPKNDFVKFLKKGEEFKYSLDYKIDKTKAPFEENEKIGVLYVLDANNIVVYEDDLIVREKVDAITIKDIMKKIFADI